MDSRNFFNRLCYVMWAITLIIILLLILIPTAKSQCGSFQVETISADSLQIVYTGNENPMAWVLEYKDFYFISEAPLVKVKRSDQVKINMICGENDDVFLIDYTPVSTPWLTITSESVDNKFLLKSKGESIDSIRLNIYLKDSLIKSHTAQVGEEILYEPPVRGRYNVITTGFLNGTNIIERRLFFYKEK